MKGTYSIQVTDQSRRFKTKYSGLTKEQAGIYWQGQCAHNGYKARLLKGRKEIARKGE